MSYELLTSDYLRAHEAAVFAMLGPDRRNYIRQASELEASKAPGEGDAYTIVRRQDDGSFIRRVCRLPAFFLIQTDEEACERAFDTGQVIITYQVGTGVSLPLLMPPDDDVVRKAVASSPTLSATAWGPERAPSAPTAATQALRASRKRTPEQRLAKYLTTVYAAADWAALDAVALAVKHAPDLDLRGAVDVAAVAVMVAETPNAGR